MNDQHDNEQDDKAILNRIREPEGQLVNEVDLAVVEEIDYDDGEPAAASVLTENEQQHAMRLQAEAAQKQIDEVDEDDSTVPQLGYMPLMPFWSFENHMIGDKPCVTITFVTPAIPNGINITLDRDRGMKFCSQLRKRLQTGPSKLTVVKPKLILS